jgi:CheY-like chemotaxis protein
MPRQLRVLVVEGQEDSREALRRQLETWSCVVDTATDGEDGVRLALQGNYDAVILDVNLPEIDGLEVGQMIAQKHAPARPYLCAFSTFEAGPLERERTELAGFDKHIEKGSAASMNELEALMKELRARLSSQQAALDKGSAN